MTPSFRRNWRWLSRKRVTKLNTWKMRGFAMPPMRQFWEYAERRQAVVVTKDEDFVERYRRQNSGPVIVWLRLGNATNAALFTWFLPILPAIVIRIESGDRLVEVR